MTNINKLRELHDAVSKSDSIKVNKLLQSKDIDFDSIEDDYTLLTRADQSGDLDIIKSVSSKTNTRKRDKRGYAPLMQAVVNNDSEAVRYLAGL